MAVQDLFEQDEREGTNAASDDELRQIPGIDPSEEKSVDHEARNGTEDIGAQESGFYNPNGDKKQDDSKALDAGALASAEGAAGVLGAGFTGGATAVAGGLKNFLWGSRRRKQATLGGGGAGVTLIAVLLGFSTLSGPAEFIQIAKLMEQFHFSSQQDESDARLSKLVHYAHGEAYKTNLGLIGNKIADSIEGKLNDQGLTSKYSSVFGQKEGMGIDLDNDNFKDFKDLPDDQKAAAIRDKMGYSSNVEITFNGDKAFATQPKGFFAQRAFTKANLSLVNDSKVSSTVAARIMGQRDGITWHPLKKLDAKLYKTLEDKVAEWRKEKVTADKEGAAANLGTEAEPDQSGSSDQQTQSEQSAGDVKSQADGIVGESSETTQKQATGTDTGNKSLGALTDSVHAKIALGGAALAGVLCMARDLADNADKLKQAQVVLPLARMGMRTITEGNQIMSGQDVDINQLGLDSQQFYDEASKTSWNSAQSIQWEEGNTDVKGTAVEPNDTLKTITKGSALDFLLTGTLGSALNPICSTAGQIVTGIIGFLGGPISSLAGIFAGQAVLSQVEPKIVSALAGDAVDPLAKGAAFGNDINFGARIAANDQAVSAGGSKLSTAQEAALDGSNLEEAKQEFASQSLTHKLFSPTDSRSLFASVLNKTSPSFGNNLNTMAVGLLNIDRSFGTIFSSLISGVAKAAPSTPYNYGFPAYGFGANDMDNTTVEDPYKNANDVAEILDNNGQNGTPDYIARAKQCFGDTLTQVSDGQPDNAMVWDVQYGTSSVNLLDSGGNNYSGHSCDDTSPNWLKIRFFIFDTQTAKATACYEGVAQTCTEMGFGS